MLTPIAALKSVAGLVTAPATAALRRERVGIRAGPTATDARARSEIARAGSAGLPAPAHRVVQLEWRGGRQRQSKRTERAISRVSSPEARI